MKKINLSIVIVGIALGIITSINPIIDNDIYELLIRLSVIPVMLLPIFIKKIFKIDISETTIFAYLTFVFLAHLLGSIYNFYSLFSWYDKFTHFLSGILTSILSLIILDKFKIKKSKIFNIIFIIAITLSIASLWEFYEFTCDNLFIKDAQKVIKTGVDDTMLDMIAAFIGSVIFSIIYSFKRSN